MKRIMMLGGSYFQMSAIKRAKELGYYVITCDYLPDNPGHKFADEYHNVSTVDREAVLELARKLNIDGILAYASDVSVATAAYVSEKLGLPSNSLRTTEILSRKDLFKSFLQENGFFTPASGSFTDYDSAYEFAKQLGRKMIIKPVDASGCKGITIIEDIKDFRRAYEEAYEYGISKIVIVEEFVEKSGYQYTGDGLIVNGKLIYMGMSKEHFDKSGNMVPVGESFPAYLEEKIYCEVCKQCQKIFYLLDFKFGTVNLEFFITSDGKIMILEIGPRSGGNLMPDAIKLSSGIDMIEYCIKMAVGDKVPDIVSPSKKENISTYILHTLQSGKYFDVHFSDEIKANIVQSDILVEQGQHIEAFKNGGKMLGALLLHYDTTEEMIGKMNNMSDYIKVILE
jgi:biotin carboxylase